MNQVYLVMVTDQNNNKYYNMEDNGNGTFTVKYGRVGGRETEKTYAISDWNKVYNSKVKKGYKDVTELRKKQASKEYKPLDDKEIQNLIDDLMRKSRQFTGEFYDGDITPVMVDEAQELINDLAATIDNKYTDDTQALNAFNKILIKLYTTLPRKMKRVQDELVYDVNKRISKITEEQALIDNLKTQTTVNNAQDDTDILSALGIQVSQCTQDDLDIINKALSDLDSKYILSRAWVVRHNQRDEDFEDYLDKNNLKNDERTVKYYWHGTRTENVFSIMANGLQVHPANAYITGKMFGNGIYNAPKSNKSMGYTSLSGSYWARGGDSVGYMFLNAVIMGHKLHTEDTRLNGIYLSDLDEQKLHSNFANYHSVYAHGGPGKRLRNDECIVYNQSQVASRYLVEIKYR